ncbi:MAG: signal recognition particle protein [Chloroflexi bacterium]|nr:signal recognition particle protein [Chloroflexi bacterium CFX1]MCK6566448.1 signal recognition particle protein [Anaerolineales bacterium]MCQ3953558.1 signal recognition particle protein [Chloroflexota bacterium]MDL1920315.1 signal recognition particle protein [Chloroflexi bacterium CFX5]NUQ59775.1 signal recognition particle protein [Anaerolineales bacterium]
MFETLTGRLNQIFDGLRKRGKLSESDVDAAMKEVRLALLEADVHFSVVKTFIAKVRERAVGAEVSKALNPGQQVVKIVNEELISALGEPAPLNLTGPRPRAVMMVGLQGSGKTTVTGKLARLLKSKGERILMVAGDPYRPAAVKQLQQLGERVGVEVEADSSIAPQELAKRALDKAEKGGYTLVLVDTAGRSQLDAQLMDEVKAISANLKPVDTLLVIDSMIGQEALNIAQGFKDAIPLTGLVLTKMDGDSRGGAAISIRSVTGIPIKFIGTGEKLDALETYDPSRLSSRILGMGDLIGLIEKAEMAYDAATAEKQAKKLMKGDFSFEDWLEQMKQMKKMGPLAQIMEMLPGQMGQAARNIDPQLVERQFKQSEAIINSMTVKERRDPDLLNASRRRRIAAGSGMDVQDVNRLVKQFREAQKLMKTLQKTGGRGLGKLFG